jgi:hypothetical protein
MAITKITMVALTKIQSLGKVPGSCWTLWWIPWQTGHNWPSLECWHLPPLASSRMLHRRVACSPPKRENLPSSVGLGCRGCPEKTSILQAKVPRCTYLKLRHSRISVTGTAIIGKAVKREVFCASGFVSKADYATFSGIIL